MDVLFHSSGHLLAWLKLAINGTHQLRRARAFMAACSSGSQPPQHNCGFQASQVVHQG
jgi:hypothetical protein